MLLEKIQAEKKRLGIKSKKLAEVSIQPFVIPRCWKWAKFSDVANIASNLTQPYLYPSVPHIAPNNMEKGTRI
ncbi:MAG: hypothetical protein H6656_21625 [Ardenticatenaceae bacterium]|nr:hypothetical protein [Ardenticatenaceae bacterium]